MMALAKPQDDECFILVKAQPHRSSNYFETVCCAGIGRDGKWRRQYPVPFRILQDDQKFKRWQWISYSYQESSDDKRLESQKVIPESIRIHGVVKEKERASFLNPLVRSSFSEAEEHDQSLVLLRPRSIDLSARRKSDSDISELRQKHAELANQFSFFDQATKPLEPCPVVFSLRWRDADNIAHKHECDDWETSAAYGRFSTEYGEKQAIDAIKTKYEDQYFKRGIALAFSTHSRRNVTNGTSNQWLLVGIIRLDFDDQQDLLLS